MAERLCGNCLRLGLRRSSFLIEDEQLPGSRLSLESLKLANQQFNLGTLSQVREKEGICSLCALVNKAASNTDIAADAECYLLWEIDGHEPATLTGSGGGARLTRRLRICWKDPKLKDYEAYMVLAAPPRYDRADLNYRGLLKKETQFLGRRLGASENKKNLIREFLRLCERYHPPHCRRQLGIESAFWNTLREPYFGVIDIENDMLVPLPFEGDDHHLNFQPYATVSYCWGTDGGRNHTTKIENIQKRRMSGGLASVIKALPKALKQSIQLVQSIGIRYIWIDALCIVQDSSHSWNLNARAMHLIYGNSTITICAADGGDASAGLVALDEDHAPPGRQDTNGPVGHGDNTEDTERPQLRQHIVDCGSGVNLILHKPPEISIETSAWNKRAWTFQERLLSKRCLIFTGGQVYFQCRSTGMSEDIFADQTGKGWSLDLVRAPLQMLSQLKQRAMWFYMQCVDLYTRRSLYEPFDILAAFIGMTKLMEITMHGSFVFGLPTSHFDLALLWEPVKRSTQLEKPRNPNDPRYKDLRFPSWSWCGWNSDGVRYKHDLVSGCTDDVKTWLADHTWIDWRIRDGHGTLRRIWDERKPDTSRDVKWRGYLSRNDGKEVQDDASISMGSYMAKSTDDESSELTAIGQEPEQSQDPNIFSNQGNHSYDERRRVKWSENSELPPVDGYDNYGRRRQGATMSESLGKNRGKFHLTLPEDPYHVNFADDSWEKAGLMKEFPDQPFLQFFTWHARFHVVRSEPDDAAAGEDELQRCHVADWRGDKCGSLLVSNKWLEKQESESQTEFPFIAISDAKSFTAEELPYWSYYIPKERHESEWDPYFVLLAEHSPNEGIHRRVAVGKVFKDAFTRKDENWKEIILG
ncbi:heterokaryon incompatibility protein-domain-containing protein [Apiospora arundinis]